MENRLIGKNISKKKFEFVLLWRKKNERNIFFSKRKKFKLKRTIVCTRRPIFWKNSSSKKGSKIFRIYLNYIYQPYFEQSYLFSKQISDIVSIFLITKTNEKVTKQTSNYFSKIFFVADQQSHLLWRSSLQVQTTNETQNLLRIVQQKLNYRVAE